MPGEALSLEVDHVPFPVLVPCPEEMVKAYLVERGKPRRRLRCVPRCRRLSCLRVRPSPWRSTLLCFLCCALFRSCRGTGAGPQGKWCSRRGCLRCRGYVLLFSWEYIRSFRSSSAALSRPEFSITYSSDSIHSRSSASSSDILRIFFHYPYKTRRSGAAGGIYNVVTPHCPCYRESGLRRSERCFGPRSGNPDSGKNFNRRGKNITIPAKLFRRSFYGYLMI